MANVLPDDSDIRFEKSKTTGRAHEEAVTNAATQSVVFAPQSLPVSDGTSISPTPEAAPPAGKGKNKNKAPDAQDDSAETAIDNDVTINVLANDSDPDGDLLTVFSVGTALNGSVELNLDNTITYTPNTGYEGIDSFTYSVEDGKGGSATATVNVTVGTPPPPPPPEEGATNYIEALTYDDANRWNSGSLLGTATEVTYTFLTATPSYYHPSSTEWRKFMEFNAEQQTLTNEMLSMIEGYADITFVETDLDAAQITYGYADLGSRYAGWAYLPDGDDGIMDHSGDVWLNGKFGEDLSLGSFYGMALLHETGHAVGLAHPHDGTIIDDSATDNRGYTVMSYNADTDGGLEPVTLMLYDIAAIQYLYGANEATNAGDTVYNLADYFATNFAIWDAAGIDTLDGSNQTVDLTLDLNDGSFSSVGLTNSLAIAFNAVIENATGGTGNDTLTGNDTSNVLIGGAGDDFLFGGAGSDTLYYDGMDVLDGGADSDTLASMYETIIDIGSGLISSIESIDLSNALGDVVNVILSDILTLSDNDDLYIVGDAGIDTVNVTGGANTGTAVNVGGVDYAHYTDGVADLFVENTLIINETGIV